jgi:hypothetical protein
VSQGLWRVDQRGRAGVRKITQLIHELRLEITGAVLVSYRSLGILCLISCVRPVGGPPVVTREAALAADYVASLAVTTRMKSPIPGPRSSRRSPGKPLNSGPGISPACDRQFGNRPLPSTQPWIQTHARPPGHGRVPVIKRSFGGAFWGQDAASEGLPWLAAASVSQRSACSGAVRWLQGLPSGPW